MPHWDDNLINQKIKQLRQQRLLIAQIATEHNLEDTWQVEQLSLLTVSTRDTTAYESSPEKEEIERTPGFQNDRIKDYHKQTAERRKIIAEKAARKRKLREEQMALE